jgi:hypothetical protein
MSHVDSLPSQPAAGIGGANSKRPPSPQDPEYARPPLVVERLGRLQGVASVLRNLALDTYDQSEGLLMFDDPAQRVGCHLDLRRRRPA